jgi:hypothetical protein
MKDGLDPTEFYKRMYDGLKIGQRVRINHPPKKYSKGMIVDKYLEKVYDQGCPEPFIDVLLDDGEMVEMFRCFNLAYPRFDKIS